MRQGGRHTKKAKRFFYLTLLLTLSLNGWVNAAFETIELLAAPAGMGGASVAAAADTGALIGNPAGLAGVMTPEIGIGYLDLYGLLGYSFIGVAHPFRDGQTLGAALLNSSDVEGLSQERVAMLSAGIRLWDRFRIGITAKYLSTAVQLEQLPLGRGTGWGTDLGIQYDLLREHLTLGGVLPNLFSNIAYRRLDATASDASYNESLYREWRIGAAVKTDPQTGTDAILVAFEIANGLPRIGCEYRHAALAVRVGWRFTEGFTAGFGYQHGSLILDYAVATENTSLFSLRLLY